MATQTTAVATTKKDVQAWIQSDKFRDSVALVLPKHLTPERFIRVTLTAMMRVPRLIQCSQQSVFKCLLDLSALGLEPDGRRAHLIPFQNKGVMECQLIIDYKGLVELMMRGGTVSNIHADVVCENDEFEYDRGEVTRHKIDFRAPRGRIYAAYCRVTFKDGTTKCEVLSKEEVDKIRSRSRAKDNGPWVTDYNEMAKKTACRRVSKWVVLSPEINEKIEADDDQFEYRERKQAEPVSIDLAGFMPSDDPNRGHDQTGDPTPSGPELEPGEATETSEPLELTPEPPRTITKDEAKALLDSAQGELRSELTKAYRAHGFKQVMDITIDKLADVKRDFARAQRGDGSEE